MKKLSVAALLMLFLAYLAWPYFVLRQLNTALVTSDMAALGQLVDLPAVRREIVKKLNKDVDSAVGEVSNAFVDWLQDGIRRLGSGAVDRLVTLDWVRAQLLAKTPAGSDQGFLPLMSYAFFDAYDRFFVRIGEFGEAPVHFRMRLEGIEWRVSAVYN